jgi:hypothetical protein
MRVRVGVLAFAAGLFLTTAAMAEISPLDPENFLDATPSQTLLLIEADLAACGSPVPLALDAEIAPAVLISDETTEAATTLAEVEPLSLGDASAEMTGSLPNLVSEGTAQPAREYEAVVTIQFEAPEVETDPYYP